MHPLLIGGKGRQNRVRMVVAVITPIGRNIKSNTHDRYAGHPRWWKWARGVRSVWWRGWL